MKSLSLSVSSNGSSLMGRSGSTKGTEISWKCSGEGLSGSALTSFLKEMKKWLNLDFCGSF